MSNLDLVLATFSERAGCFHVLQHGHLLRQRLLRPKENNREGKISVQAIGYYLVFLEDDAAAS